MPQLYDMHLHLEAFAQPEAVARELAARDVGLLSVTVSPMSYEETVAMGPLEGVRYAAGLHPWGFASGEDPEPAIQALLELVGQTRLVGEIGIDYLENHVPREAWASERDAFESVCRACAEASDPAHPHVLSIHSVRAASDALDIIEETGCHERCCCIFHWFSGSNEELWRAIRLGCWFSCGPFMMGVKRSREYVKLIPADRLLLETDYPPGDTDKSPSAWADEVRDKLLEAASAIASARGSDVDEVLLLTRENIEAVLA